MGHCHLKDINRLLQYDNRALGLEALMVKLRKVSLSPNLLHNSLPSQHDDRALELEALMVIIRKASLSPSLFRFTDYESRYYCCTVRRYIYLIPTSSEGTRYAKYGTITAPHST